MNPNRRAGAEDGPVLGVQSSVGSGLDAFEGHFALDESCEVGLDGVESGDSVDEGGGADEVGALDEFEAWLFEFESGGVEGASLVGDEDDAFEFVDLDEEVEFVDDAFFLEVGLGVSGHAGWAAGEADAVVAWEVEALLEEVVEVLAESAIGAVDGGGVDSGGLVLDGTGVRLWHVVGAFVCVCVYVCLTIGVGESLRAWGRGANGCVIGGGPTDEGMVAA